MAYICEKSSIYKKKAPFSPPETLRECVHVKVLFTLQCICVHVDVCMCTTLVSVCIMCVYLLHIQAAVEMNIIYSRTKEMMLTIKYMK